MLTTSLGVIEERDKITPTHAFLDCRRNQHWMSGAGVNLVNVSDDLLDGRLFVTYRNRMGVFLSRRLSTPLLKIIAHIVTTCSAQSLGIIWPFAFTIHLSTTCVTRHVSAHLQKPLFSEATFSTNLIIPPAVQYCTVGGIIQVRKVS